jgi:UDP-2,4-diacetamido-2,4,6-trideoxy-beta-L-altropyranose hydrolase
MRSCVLADTLVKEGWHSAVVTSQDTYNFLPGLERFQHFTPQEFDKNPPECDLFVIDNYDLDALYQRKLSQYVKKIMVIDDFANKEHNCDILLNQNFGYNASDYENLVPPSCKLLLGVEYCMVDASFYKLSKPTTRIQNILFYMGGAGNIDLIQGTALTCAKDFNVGIVAGFLKKATIKDANNKITIFPHNKIIEAYRWSDLCVGFAGQGMFERYIAGIPSLIFSQNSMQEDVLKKIKSPNILYCGDIRDVSYDLIEKKRNEIMTTYKYVPQAPNFGWINEI